MLHILICDDNPNHLAKIEAIVKKYISTEDVEAELSVSASTPEEILEYLDRHPTGRGLYFLDVDLRHKMNGIELGAEIRKTDPFAKIVFVTTHDELAYLTFKHKVNALDYIVKDHSENLEPRTIECISKAYTLYVQEKYTEQKFFRVNTGNEAANIPHDDILFFETHPQIRKRMILHTESGKIDFRGIISKVEELVPEFFRCYQSNLINPDKVLRVDKVAKEAVMVNGRRVLIAEKNVAILAKMIGDK